MSLVRATDELLMRIAKAPAPVTVKSGAAANKTSELPAGISGPVVRTRRRSDGSEAKVAEFCLILPRFSKSPNHRTVYIGSQHSYTVAKYNDALAKAMELRKQAELKYHADATRHRRREASAYKADLAIKSQSEL